MTEAHQKEMEELKKAVETKKTEIAEKMKIVQQVCDDAENSKQFCRCVQCTLLNESFS